MTGSPIDQLSAIDESTGAVNAIVECPQGTRNKYTFESTLGHFVLSGILPLGSTFPFDFGFIPGTLGGDGDPLDVLILMDEPAFTGCLVRVRLIGMIEAEQTEAGKTERNDRLIAVAAKSRTHASIRSINHLNQTLIDQMEYFFISYNREKGQEFKPIGRFGAVKARRLVNDSIVHAAA